MQHFLCGIEKDILRPQTFRLAKTFASLRWSRRKFEVSEFSLALSLNSSWLFFPLDCSLALICQPSEFQASETILRPANIPQASEIQICQTVKASEIQICQTVKASEIQISQTVKASEFQASETKLTLANIPQASEIQIRQTVVASEF